MSKFRHTGSIASMMIAAMLGGVGEQTSTRVVSSNVDKVAAEPKKVKPEKERRIRTANRKLKVGPANRFLNQRQYRKKLRQNPHLRNSKKCRV